MANPTTITRNAALLGTSFAEHYYAVMRTTPEHADKFYDDSGEYQTVYEDCTAVIARTRQQVQEVLSRPMAASKLTVQSIFSVPYGGSVERLLVIVTGQSFVHVFVAEYRPKRLLNYVIVTSLVQYVHAGQAGEGPNQKTTLDTGDCRIGISNDRTPTACLKAKKQVVSSQYLTNYHNPFPNTVTDNVQPDIIIDNALFRFINNITNPAKITISHEPLPAAATDNTSTADSKANKHVRITSDKATNHETLIDNFKDSTQHGIVTEIPPIIFLKCESNPIETKTPKEPSPQNTASINVNQNLVTENPPSSTFNRLPSPSQMSTPREPSLNSPPKNNHLKFGTENSQIQILKHVPPPTEIKPSRKPLPSILATYYSQLDLTDKNSHVPILNREPNSTEVSTLHETSTPNTASINLHQNLVTPNPPTTTLNRLPSPSQMSTSRENSTNAFTKKSHQNFATRNTQIKISNHVSTPPELKSSRKPLASIIAYYNSKHGLAEKNSPGQILTRTPKSTDASTAQESSTPNTARRNVSQNITTQNPPTTNFIRVPIPSDITESREPHANATTQNNHPNSVTGNSQIEIIKRVPRPPEIKSSRKPLSSIIDFYNSKGLAEK
ncbi:Nuclear transport factor 2, eukaryote,NTF2-like domain [Cinara cedri]|uniref:Nuclear transport factor 2, eukaryote,NTF2-like domain n=1 Tax=Cinara cedri TaxID=506608 RepID=A0A5E4ML33_9HEMI|nr:Nuclear transport factor 2, eukaryote,NTF2-like domain [Cinara cedri]